TWVDSGIGYLPFVVARQSLVLPACRQHTPAIKITTIHAPTTVMARPSGPWPSSALATIATGLLHDIGARLSARQADLSIQIPILCFRRSRKLIRIGSIFVARSTFSTNHRLILHPGSGSVSAENLLRQSFGTLSGR